MTSSTSLPRRPLGSSRLSVSRLGLGCMGMSEFYGARDDARSIRTIHHALDRGVNFFDTADMYGPYINEELLGRALQGRRDGAVIATKCGFVRDPANPESARSTIARSTSRRAARGACATRRRDASTCTTCTATIRRRRRSRRLSARWPIWSSRARCARSGSRKSARRRSRRRARCIRSRRCRPILAVVARTRAQRRPASLPRSWRHLRPVQPAQPRLPERRDCAARGFRP